MGAQLLSQVQLFATPWTVAHHAQTLSVEFSRQAYISISAVSGHSRDWNDLAVNSIHQKL